MMRPQTFAMAKQPNVVLRPAAGSKFALKEKFVQIYEAFFTGDDPSLGKPSFWDELFLLRVNEAFLTRCIELTTAEQLMALKDNINKIVLTALEYTRDANGIRAANAFETLALMFRGICTKNFNNFTFDIIDLLTGIDRAEDAFRELVTVINDALRSRTLAVPQKRAALHLLCVMLTTTENLNANSLVQYLMHPSLFETLLHTLSDPTMAEYASEALAALSLLINFRKYEGANPFVTQVASVASPSLVAGVMAVLAQQLRAYSTFLTEQITTPSLLSLPLTSPKTAAAPTTPTATSSGGSWFTGPHFSATCLALYELGRANYAFVTLALRPGTSTRRPYARMVMPVKEATVAVLTSSQFMRLSLPPPGRRADGISEDSAVPPPTSAAGEDTADAFLCAIPRVCALLAQVPVAHVPLARAHLAVLLLTLTAIAQEPGHAGDLFSRKLIFRPSLPQMQQRKFPLDNEPRPLAAAIYDSLALVLWCCRTKPLAVDAVVAALTLLQRLLHQQIRLRVRLSYDWSALYESVFAMVEAVAATIKATATTADDPLWTAADKLARITNIWLIYGDMLLPTNASYARLLYELMRHAGGCETLRAAALLLEPAGTNPGTPRGPGPVAQCMAQLVDTVTFLTEELELAKRSRGISLSAAEEVLEVLGERSENLKLRQIDGIEAVERYKESPTWLRLFRRLVRECILETRVSPVARAAAL